MWQWSNFLHAHVPPSEKAVVVNMDETSIRLYQQPGRGYMVQVARRRKRSAKSLTHNVAKGRVLGTFTHVAMICDDDDLQPHLPQFLFINRTQISQAEFDCMQSEWHPNIHAHRVVNPWMTNDKMKLVLEGLATAVAAHSERRRVVLCADAHRSHIATSTWKSAAARNIFYFIIPPKLTWALQPCDTHLFAMFKDKLTTTCQHLAIANGRRRWDITLLLKALNTSVSDVLNKRSWRKAFVDLGYCGHQRDVSTRALEKVDLTERPQVPDAIPSLATLKMCFPHRTNIPIGHVFSAVLQADRQVRGLPKEYPPETEAPEFAPSSSSRGPRVHLVRLGHSRSIPTVVDGGDAAEEASAIGCPSAVLPKLARLGSMQRMRLEPTAHEQLPTSLGLPPRGDPTGS